MRTEPTILVAGIGNIFLGDDAFGVEVVQRLLGRDWPEGVRVADYGIRGFDLAYAILDDPDAVVLIDALPRGGSPGTLYLLEPDRDDFETLPATVDGHSMDPLTVLRLVAAFGGQPRRLLVVGCEPASLGGEGGEMALSAPVQAALDPAVELIAGLVDRLRSEIGALATP